MALDFNKRIEIAKKLHICKNDKIQIVVKTDAGELHDNNLNKTIVTLLHNRQCIALNYENLDGDLKDQALSVFDYYNEQLKKILGL